MLSLNFLFFLLIIFFVIYASTNLPTMTIKKESEFRIETAHDKV